MNHFLSNARLHLGASYYPERWSEEHWTAEDFKQAAFAVAILSIEKIEKLQRHGQ